MNSVPKLDYLISFVDLAVLTTAFVVIAIVLSIAIWKRRQTEQHLRSSIDALRDLRVIGFEADERFRYLFDNTSNVVYCYKFDPAMAVDLPIEAQIERSLSATLCHCNPAFAEQSYAKSPLEVLGQKAELLDRGIDSATYARYFRDFVDNDYLLRDYEHQYNAADGNSRAISANVTGIVNEGHLERVWFVETDVLPLRVTKFALERRQTFLELMAWVSSKLVTASDEKADGIVEECLEEICSYFNADRSTIFWLEEDNPDVAVIEYFWRAHKKELRGPLPLKMYPAFIARLNAKQPVRIDHVSAMPDEFAVERKELERHELKALIILPMVVAEDVVGGMTLGRSERDDPWSDDDLQDAIVLSELLANFVLRLRSHRALNQALEGLQRATDRLEAENVYLREEVEPKHSFEGIIGKSNAVLRCLKLVEQVARTKAPVLILGETGTGKELVAHAIHKLSDRGARPLVKVNCAALPASLIESELFGHEKGAFTGASGGKRGRFDLADGSTLLLDEFGEIPLELQAKLLRVLQEGEFERLGGAKTVRVDVRILVATNRDLGEAVQEGSFRSDLYYRINTFPIELPALRSRGSDIELLAEHFVKLHAPMLDREVQEISSEMMRQLHAYSWPGNVRELEGIIQRALISSSGPVLDLAEPLVSSSFDDGMPKIISSSIADLKLVERDHILSVLEDTRWKISGESGAAARLGIPPSTLRSKMKKLNIIRPH